MRRSTFTNPGHWWLTIPVVLQVLGLASSGWAQEVVPPQPRVQAVAPWPPGASLVQGLVVPVILTVAKDGRVTEVQIEASLGPELDQAAVATARKWTFEPARSEGKAVAAKVRAMVRFPGKSQSSEPKLEPKPEVDARNARSTTAREKRQPASANQGGTAPETIAAGANFEVTVAGEKASPPRSASETSRDQTVIAAAPHRTGGDVLQVVPGVFITQHSGQGKAYQVFFRGFDAVHGQDLEFWVGGAPVNEVSNIHGQGYADLHFVMPEVISKIQVLPGNYSPEQGDFAVAGTIRYQLGYSEPGITAKGTLGSFGERRVFLAYHPEGSNPGSFAAFEAQSTQGFGPARAAQRTSAIAQHLFKVGEDHLRVLATGYAGRFDSPGVVRLADLERGALGRFDTYGVNQGGLSSRYQLVTEYSGGRERSDWSIAPYAVLRGLQLKQNYTGYLINPTDGDSTQLINESVTLGLTGHYHRRIRLFSDKDSAEAGVSVRNDWVSQSQRDVGIGNDRVLSTLVDAKIRALDAAGWLDLAVVPIPRIRVRAGLRVDGLSYGVQDSTPASDSRAGTHPSSFGNQLRPPSVGGQARASMGSHFGPRITLDGAISGVLHGVLSYGQGFRSPQARSLGDGEKTPFTRVESMEAGLRYGSGGIRGSLSVFRTTLNQDLVFDSATTRNEAVPASSRVGGALEFVVQPVTWFVSSGSGTFTRATFTQSDSNYHAGDKLPYVPELIVRQDLAFTPTLGRWLGRDLTGRFGTALTGMFNRPQPYGALGHDIVLVDARAELRLKEAALGIDLFNLLDAHWYDSEFTYSANWNPGAVARLVPERYVTVGAPRTFLATLSLFVD